MRQAALFLLVISLISCTSGTQTPNTPSASPSAMPSTGASPSAEASPAPQASPSTADSPQPSPTTAASEAPAEVSPVLMVEHAISVKKDGAPLNIANNAKREINGKALKYEFGVQNGFLEAGKYSLTIGYNALEKSPVEDGLELADLDKVYVGGISVSLKEGTGSLPKTYYLKSATTPTSSLTIKDGKLSMSYKAEFAPLNNASSFMLEVDIQDAPLK